MPIKARGRNWRGDGDQSMGCGAVGKAETGGGECGVWRLSGEELRLRFAVCALRSGTDSWLFRQEPPAARRARPAPRAWPGLVVSPRLTSMRPPQGHSLPEPELLYASHVEKPTGVRAARCCTVLHGRPTSWAPTECTHTSASASATTKRPGHKLPGSYNHSAVVSQSQAAPARLHCIEARLCQRCRHEGGMKARYSRPNPLAPIAARRHTTCTNNTVCKTRSALACPHAGAILPQALSGYGRAGA